MFPHTFSLFTTSTWKSEMLSQLPFKVLIDTTFRAGRKCGHERRLNRLFTHTPIHVGEYAHCISNSRTNQHHSVRGSIQRKIVKAVDLSQHSIPRGSRSVIRMRTMSSSVSVTALELFSGFPSASMLHTVTRYFSKPFLASYFDSLASSSPRYFFVSCTIRSISDRANFSSHDDTLADRVLNALFCVFPMTP